MQSPRRRSLQQSRPQSVCGSLLDFSRRLGRAWMSLISSLQTLGYCALDWRFQPLIPDTNTVLMPMVNDDVPLRVFWDGCGGLAAVCGSCTIRHAAVNK
jgi:hypothetical protein